jgi:hypothetical protein
MFVLEIVWFYGLWVVPEAFSGRIRSQNPVPMYSAKLDLLIPVNAYCLLGIYFMAGG